MLPITTPEINKNSMNILITGTSSGIGKGLAQEYLNQGHHVWGISRRNADISVSKTSGVYTHLCIDLTDYKAVSEQVPLFIRSLVSCDLVVLNAGKLGRLSLTQELSLDEMKEVMEVNMWSQKFLLDILLTQISQVSQVVGMSTKSSLRSSPGWASYSLSKAALNMLMNVYATEYPNTHFMALAPGLVDSEIQDYIWSVQDTDSFPAVKTLQDARYTDTMPTPEKAAPMLIHAIQEIRRYTSGSFADVRDM